jgi:transcriptional regulator with XRE-family HTH domain
MLQIHENIKQQRILAGLSEEEMSKRLGIKRSTYQYWEKETPHLSKIMRVAEVLNIPVRTLTDENLINDENKTMAHEPGTPLKKEELSPDGAQRERSLHALIESNRVLVETNRDLTGMLKQSFYSKLNSDSQQHISVTLLPYLQRLAAGGVGKFWKDENVGLIELNRMLLENAAVETKLGK